MSLFGSKRDSEFFNSINRELIVDVVDSEVAYYKFNKEDTVTDIYNESKTSIYHNPVLIACLVKRGDQQWNNTDGGDDLTQTISFGFVRDMLVDLDLKPEQGDVIEFNKEYWEVDSVIENSYFMSRNPETTYSGPEWGYNASVIVTGRFKQRSSLRGIVEENPSSGIDYFD